MSKIGHFKDYKVVIEDIESKPGCWNLTIATVYRNEEEIIKIKRNYSHFWYEFCEHPDGNTYFLCGEDYQGQTIVNLNTKEKKSYRPPEAAKGFGFCWANVKVSPNGEFIAVEGCIWAAPYEVRLYDFSDPMAMPWPEVKIKNAPGWEWTTVVGWDEDDILELEKEFEFSMSTGKRTDDMEPDEVKAYDDDEPDWGFGREIRGFKIKRA